LFVHHKSERVVRNIAIVAHVDHGKTTLTDSLVKKAGLSNKENALDRAHPDQIERNITIKSTGAALQFGDLSVNLIDSPGHVDFSSEVSSALRLSDGACVVVDCASGVKGKTRKEGKRRKLTFWVKVQTITVLKQALAEAVVPVLVLNKFDRLIVELRLSPEEVFARLSGIIDQINDIIATYAPAAMPSLVLSPLDGTVLFAAGKQSWGFSLPQLSKLMAAKSGASEQALLSAMWGEVYFNPESGKVSNLAFSSRDLLLHYLSCLCFSGRTSPVRAVRAASANWWPARC
jgi:elongation factor 2